MITYCPECKAKYNLPDSRKGIKFRCKMCGGTVYTDDLRRLDCLDPFGAEAAKKAAPKPPAKSAAKVPGALPVLGAFDTHPKLDALEDDLFDFSDTRSMSADIARQAVEEAAAESPIAPAAPAASAEEPIVAASAPEEESLPPLEEPQAPAEEESSFSLEEEPAAAVPAVEPEALAQEEEPLALAIEEPLPAAEEEATEPEAALDVEEVEAAESMEIVEEVLPAEEELTVAVEAPAELDIILPEPAPAQEAQEPEEDLIDFGEDHPVMSLASELVASNAAAAARDDSDDEESLIDFSEDEPKRAPVAPAAPVLEEEVLPVEETPAEDLLDLVSELPAAAELEEEPLPAEVEESEPLVLDEAEAVAEEPVAEAAPLPLEEEEPALALLENMDEEELAALPVAEEAEPFAVDTLAEAEPALTEEEELPEPDLLDEAELPQEPVAEQAAQVPAPAELPQKELAAASELAEAVRRWRKIIHDDNDLEFIDDDPASLPEAPIVDLHALFPRHKREVRAVCSACNARYHLPEHYSSRRKLRCAVCQQPVTILDANEEFPPLPAVAASAALTGAALAEDLPAEAQEPICSIDECADLSDDAAASVAEAPAPDEESEEPAAVEDMVEEITDDALEADEVLPSEEGAVAEAPEAVELDLGEVAAQEEEDLDLDAELEALPPVEHTQAPEADDEDLAGMDNLEPAKKAVERIEEPAEEAPAEEAAESAVKPVTADSPSQRNFDSSRRPQRTESKTRSAITEDEDALFDFGDATGLANVITGSDSSVYSPITNDTAAEMKKKKKAEEDPDEDLIEW